MTLLTIISLIASIGCYSISQLLIHEKFKWLARDYSFWGGKTYLRKYKFPLDSNVNNWYYRFFKIKYKERFPLSATFLVFLTDGYHLNQALFMLFVSLSVTFALGFSWWLLLGVWSLIHIVHFITYKVLSK